MTSTHRAITAIALSLALVGCGKKGNKDNASSGSGGDQASAGGGGSAAKPPAKAPSRGPEHVVYSLTLYRRTRTTLRDRLQAFGDGPLRRVALYGTGEAAELAYLTLRELGTEPVAVFAEDADGAFLGLEVKRASQLADEPLDAIIVATFDRPDALVRELQRRHGVPAAKCVTLRPVAESVQP